MAQTHVYTDASLPADLECQAVSFIRIQWPFVFDGDNRFGRRIRTGHDPIHETVAHVVIEEQRVLMSYATIIRTHLLHQHATYCTYGLSSVFTYPAFRGEGWATQLVQTATQHIRSREDADPALLGRAILAGDDVKEVNTSSCMPASIARPLRTPNLRALTVLGRGVAFSIRLPSFAGHT